MNNLSKTPQFDEALNKILNNLAPHELLCKQCTKNFQIFAEDIEFYKMLRVPPPTLCPDCRMQRRLGWRISMLPIFYKKRCSVPGHKEDVITFHSSDSSVKVYDDQYYLSDAWDGLDFGRSYELKDSFFEQFCELSYEASR